jgi:hypothetical protein
MKRQKIALSLLALLTASLAGLNLWRAPQTVSAATTESPSPTASLATAVTKAKVEHGVWSITLPQFPPDLPDGDGKLEFIASCSACHSFRYITSQPRQPRKTWQATVTKMVKNFGAPVADEPAKKIVDYLVRINGREE